MVSIAQSNVFKTNKDYEILEVTRKRKNVPLNFNGNLDLFAPIRSFSNTNIITTVMVRVGDQHTIKEHTFDDLLSPDRLQEEIDKIYGLDGVERAIKRLK